MTYTKKLPKGDIVFFDGRGDALDGYSAAKVWEIVNALQAENERLAHANNALKLAVSGLQAKLDAMGKGEPVSEILLEAAEVLDKVQSQCDDAWERFGLRDYLPDELHGTALIVRDAAPKALAPSREVIGRYMADKGFYLSKEAMDGLMTKLGESGCQPKAQAPLTDEQVVDIAKALRMPFNMAFARAIEAAHGIGGTP